MRPGNGPICFDIGAYVNLLGQNALQQYAPRKVLRSRATARDFLRRSQQRGERNYISCPHIQVWSAAAVSGNYDLVYCLVRSELSAESFGSLMIAKSPSPKSQSKRDS